MKDENMTKHKGPDSLRFYSPIIEVLRELGGSGRPAEVTDLVIERINIPEDEHEITNKNGGSRVRNQVAWARFYLVKAGLLSSSQRGVWGLTEKGSNIEIDDEFAFKHFRDVHQELTKGRKARESAKKIAGEDETDVAAAEVGVDYQVEVLSILQSLPPEGFERICQRLLRESGFQQVIVTGKTGDGGIDGHGILQINPLVSFKVLFQCKRYQGPVAVSAVRDFRGALQGRADKGIILTTGTFTTDAKREAIRDGATTIELVDGDKLVEMFEKLNLGLRPKKNYEIDDGFFEQYRKNS